MYHFIETCFDVYCAMFRSFWYTLNIFSECKILICPEDGTIYIENVAIKWYFIIKLCRWRWRIHTLSVLSFMKVRLRSELTEKNNTHELCVWDRNKESPKGAVWMSNFRMPLTWVCTLVLSWGRLNSGRWLVAYLALRQGRLLGVTGKLLVVDLGKPLEVRSQITYTFEFN